MLSLAPSEYNSAIVPFESDPQRCKQMNKARDMSHHGGRYAALHLLEIHNGLFCLPGIKDMVVVVWFYTPLIQNQGVQIQNQFNMEESDPTTILLSTAQSVECKLNQLNANDLNVMDI